LFDFFSAAKIQKKLEKTTDFDNSLQAKRLFRPGERGSRGQVIDFFLQKVCEFP
jgi:hypothetical protein